MYHYQIDANSKVTAQKILASLLIIISLLGFGWVLVSIFYLAQTGQVDSAGIKDFIEYWSAFQIALSGGNPYDPKVMYALQIKLGTPWSEAIMMYNPPWLLVILAPILSLPFAFASSVWIVTNIILMLVCAVLAWRLSSTKDLELLPCILGAGCFYPILRVIQFGQLGLLLAVVFLAFFVLVARKQDFWAGVMLSIWSVKPHLFLLVGVGLALWIFQNKRWRILLGCASSLVLIIILSLFLVPDGITLWQKGFGGVQNFKGATAVLWLRELIFAYNGSLPSWPFWLVPGLACIVTAWRVRTWQVNQKGFWDWAGTLPILACWSMFWAPYGYLFDQAFLVFVQMQIVTRLSELSQLRRREVLMELVVLNFAPIYLQHYFYDYQLAWFPLALLAIWYRSQSEVQS